MLTYADAAREQAGHQNTDETHMCMLSKPPFRYLNLYAAAQRENKRVIKIPMKRIAIIDKQLAMAESLIRELTAFAQVCMCVC